MSTLAWNSKGVTRFGLPDASIEQASRKSSHNDTPSSDTGVRDIHETLALSLGVNVCAIDIVSQDRRHGNQLRGESTGNSHEYNQKRSNSAAGSKKCNSRVRQSKTSADLRFGHEVGECWEAG
jgi:hypothetical protein